MQCVPKMVKAQWQQWWSTVCAQLGCSATLSMALSRRFLTHLPLFQRKGGALCRWTWGPTGTANCRELQVSSSEGFQSRRNNNNKTSNKEHLKHWEQQQSMMMKHENVVPKRVHGEFKKRPQQRFKKRHKSMTIGWMTKNDRALRAARFSVPILNVVCLIRTPNFHHWGSDDNASLQQQQLCYSLPLHENHSCQEIESTLHLFCTTWPT